MCGFMEETLVIGVGREVYGLSLTHSDTKIEGIYQHHLHHNVLVD